MGSSLDSAKLALGLAPISGSTLFRREIERRERLHWRGVVPTGCSEIDDALLLGGGFERGCVVGVSAEEVDFGILLGVQTIARALVFEGSPNRGPTTSPGGSKQRATIVTTLPVTAILPILRDVIRAQVQNKLGPRDPGIDAELRRCLEVISISRIFDIEGLQEVLGELDEAQVKAGFHHNEYGGGEMTGLRVPEGDRDEKLESEVKSAAGSLEHQEREANSTEEGPGKANADLVDVVPGGPSPEPAASSPGPVTQLPPLRIGLEVQPLARRLEILDSEDEEPLSSSPLSSPPPSTVAPQSPSPPEYLEPPVVPDPHPSPSPAPESEPGVRSQESEVAPTISTETSPLPVPDIIVVTHFSALLVALFTHSDKALAHTNLQLLSSRLQHLARSAGPLIMLLNTTTSPLPDTFTSTSRVPRPFDANHPVTPAEATKPQRPLDATLRSIFSPATQLHSVGVDRGHRPAYGSGHAHDAATPRLARQNKPSFGATFAQFLDLHLLCTKVPRTRDDAETSVALGAGAAAEDVRYAWVVEALLDERGVWEWGKVAALETSKGPGKDERQDTHLPPRVSREQRWAAVDVLDGVTIVDAFGGSKDVNRGPVRTAAGFGGPRV